VTIVALFAARRPSNGDSAGYRRTAVVKRHAAGVATLVGTVQTIGTDNEDAGVTGDVTLDVSGNDVRARVTGAAAQTWEWGCEMQILVLTP
jgi:hypothetical protein